MKDNLLTTVRADAAAEQFEDILVRPGVRIERIVSSGQASPPGFWYDQPQGEWVLLLQGSAQIGFSDTTQTVDLTVGDHLWIAPRRRHRVAATSAEPPAVWLAVHITESAEDESIDAS